MKNVFFFLALSFVFFSCGDSKKQNYTDTPVKPTSTSINNYTLYRNTLGHISLENFDDANALELLKKNYPNAKIAKEIGQQDGPDFPLYTITYKGENNNVLISMNDIKANKIDQVQISNPKFKDEYGVKVGDDLASIKNKRKDKFKILVADHYQTYMIFGEEKTRYLLTGNFINTLVDKGRMGDVITEDDIKGAKVAAVVWWNYTY